MMDIVMARDPAGVEAELPPGFDLGVEKEEAISGNRVRFLAARGAPCGFPTAILWFFSARTDPLWVAERDFDSNAQLPHSKEWDP
ncbi:hypothetical protein NZK35_03135 [Stieleria sp. ICT_E10.1]|uniref:hypothetical protein n=1 Tax=Stieleria sedimenti TaxID=2976331 RepID=UPI00217F375A|nr:hypothetical protein [Stieleria sedimenti]MCS7465666.1 hypothetical protein [Stieleria sedimenti]